MSPLAALGDVPSATMSFHLKELAGEGYKFGAWRDVGGWQKDLQPPGAGEPAPPRRPDASVAGAGS